MITGNENAYPLYGPDVTSNELGLTIRQHFAAMAMQGFCANNIIQHYDADFVAQYSAKYADALIAELNKNETA